MRAKMQPRLWTPEEDIALREMCTQGMTRVEIARELDRTPESVRHRIKKIGLAKEQPGLWSPEEDNILKKLHGNGTAIKKIALQLGKSLDSVEHRIIKIGLSKERARPWSLEEDNLLIEMYKNGAKNKEIFPKLCRSLDAIVHRKVKLFKKVKAELPLKNGVWTPEEDNLLKKMDAGGATSAEIALQLGRSVMAVEGKKRRMNLTVCVDLVPEEIKNDEMKLREWVWENKIKPGLVETDNGCLEWQGCTTGDGYGSVDAARKTFATHRVAVEITIGKILPEDIFALHSCDNPPCCNPAHLRPGTRKNNSADMVSRGRSCKGEKSGSAKMTDKLVQLARFLYVPGIETYQQLADEFNISLTAMYNIIKRNTWTHVAHVPPIPFQV